MGVDFCKMTIPVVVPIPVVIAVWIVRMMMMKWTALVVSVVVENY